MRFSLLIGILITERFKLQVEDIISVDDNIKRIYLPPGLEST